MGFFSQVPLLDSPAGRVLVDIHMACYALSLARYLLHKAGIHGVPASSLMQPEFRGCVLFRDGDVHDALCSNPAYSELLLVSWLRSMGVMSNEHRLRFKWVRKALRGLLTAQSVKSPRTSTHLLRAVVHVFLLAIPACSTSIPAKLSAPFIALVVFPLLALAEELEDPFGGDVHDL